MLNYCILSNSKKHDKTNKKKDLYAEYERRNCRLFFHVTKKGSLHISEGESVPDNYGVEPEEYI